MDEGGTLFGIVISIGLIIFVIYVIAIMASIIATAAAAGGTVWGGGTAIYNYGRSFKKNMVDSNRAIA